MDLIASIGLNAIVGDFAPRPVDPVGEVFGLILAVEPKKGHVAVGRAEDRAVGLDGGEGELGFVEVPGGVEVDQSPFGQCGHLVEADLDRRRIGPSRADLADGVHKASFGTDQHIGELDVDLSTCGNGGPFAAGPARSRATR